MFGRDFSRSLSSSSLPRARESRLSSDGYYYGTSFLKDSDANGVVLSPKRRDSPLEYTTHISLSKDKGYNSLSPLDDGRNQNVLQPISADYIRHTFHQEAQQRFADRKKSWRARTSAHYDELLGSPLFSFTPEESPSIPTKFSVEEDDQPKTPCTESPTKNIQPVLESSSPPWFEYSSPGHPNSESTPDSPQIPSPSFKEEPLPTATFSESTFSKPTTAVEIHEPVVVETQEQRNYSVVETVAPSDVPAPQQSSSLSSTAPPLATEDPSPTKASPTSRQLAEEKYAAYVAKAVQCKGSFHDLDRDTNLKALKSAAFFVSSNPVTICSPNSPMEIVEPYRKAFFLLRGSRMETNTIPVALSDHPQVVHFVRYNMAKKFIDVAALQTEEKNEVKLFALATLLTELWACDPEFGEVFLALLYTECPSLVPVSYKMEGNVEVYLRRLGALSKFYAAIMQTDRRLLLTRVFPTKQFHCANPHGAEAAWALLAGIVNGEVQLGITVLVLRNLLNIAGWLLAGTYGKQFTKMVHLISRQLLPRIRKRTPAELLGPVERLAESLADFHRLQTFPVPASRLDKRFWTS
ncbi:mRNA export factor GLE1-like [Paramacrobiotus metropolitanus]|uniref:mRNA export factor GLE1-like n=1 Tax=Paramacrobiotus metropolitanus TaxID=2943436 RepID=UPI002445F10C|nr:mRNA export factor GLE1-like [Paramacrobiotus metropolitanus]